ncbi:MAG TPA: hypothetical protein VGV38_17430, partial [Pyrinomonadaceae bacterium]|nr:hypothetical protein [Pyrinomonadaceae bacterium]
MSEQNTDAPSSAIESVLQESRTFPPPEEFAALAHVRGMEAYEQLYAEADQDPEGFWAGVAED